MPDTEHEAGLEPTIRPWGCADATPLATPAHRADASAPGKAPPWGPPETRAKSDALDTTPDTPERAAEREKPPSGHNRDEDSFDAVMESCMSDPDAVATSAAPRVRPEPRRDYAEDTPLTVSCQAHVKREYTALR